MSFAYEEVIDFIAAGATPAEIIAFRPSAETQARLQDLLARHHDGHLTADEQTELDHYLQLEHLMRLAKAKARQHLPAR